MTRISFMFVVAVAAMIAAPAQAKDFIVGALKISAPWSRATPKGASVGGGYMTITNTGSASDRLIGGSSDIASRFEVHEMKMENGVMKMRPVKGGIEIKPGQTVKLDPSGYHVMFIGLKHQLMQGQHFKGTLEFAKAGKVAVEFSVAGIGAMKGDAMPGMGGMKMK
jgi:periplasmic copper chaperone A